MYRIIKADMYRILRGKALYITLAFFVLNIFVNTMLGGGVIGVQVSTQSEVESEMLEEPAADEVVTGSEMPFRVMRSAHEIFYFLLPLLVCLVSADLSNGCVKNTLSAGVSRSKLYFAKLILHTLFCIAGLTLSVVLSIGFGTLYNGFGSGIDFMGILQIFFAQLLYLVAAGSVGIALAFSVKKTARLNASYLAFFLLPQVAVMILVMTFPALSNIVYMELGQGIGLLVDIAEFDQALMTRVILIGITYIVGSIALGITIFKKSEVK